MLTLPSISRSSRKLPPIEVEENHSNNKNIIRANLKSTSPENNFNYESVKANIINSKSENKEHKVALTPTAEVDANEEKVKAEETVVKEIPIDTLDDIDKPGIFVSASLFLDAANDSKIQVKKTYDEIKYHNEIHIFMSSFFSG